MKTMKAEKYMKLVHTIHRLRKKNTSVHDNESMTLIQIVNHENITPIQLSQQLALTPQMVSGFINALEEKGFVARKLSASDRRKFLLYATSEGKAQAEIIKQSNLEEVMKMLVYIGEEDVDHLIRIYEKILTHYSEVK